MQTNEYELLDSGDGKKLERFGPYVLERPCAQAVWSPQFPERWKKSMASFDRNDGLNWSGRERMPESWVVPIQGVRMKLSTTDFGHLGVFPETRHQWAWIEKTIRALSAESGRTLNFLNLFAYSGGATLAAAKAGAACCHLDASKGMVDWARENAALNGLEGAPIRWIVEDVNKFLQREIRRGRRYDAVLLDPPSFGRGRKGELYKVEKDLVDTLVNVKQVLSDDPAFVLLTSHTPGFSPLVLQNLLMQILGKGRLACGEMLLSGGEDTLALPNGTWSRWMAARWKTATPES